MSMIQQLKLQQDSIHEDNARMLANRWMNQVLKIAVSIACK